MTSIVDLKKSQHNRPHEFVRYLSKKHNVTVLSINDWWKNAQDALNENDSCGDFLQKIDYRYITDKKISPIIQEIFFKKEARSIKKGDFSAHLNYNSLITGFEVSKKINTVFDVADDLTAMIGSSPQIPRILRPFGAMIGDYYLNKNLKSSKIITVTGECLKQKYKVPDDKIALIPNGVDSEIFKNYGDTKKEFGFNGFVIGYVGVLREWVDLEPIFRALKVLNKEINMVIVGKEGSYPLNYQLSKKCGVSDRVTFAGNIPYNQVAKYISAMDVCVIPFKQGSISNGALPLKLFEYMACEKPVISSRIPEIVRIANDFVLFASDVSEYVLHINSLYQDTALRKKIGKQGRTLVVENYNWNALVAKLENLLYYCSENA